jgi:hypothetical protein
MQETRHSVSIDLRIRLTAIVLTKEIRVDSKV